jgi:hypothetical protein
MVKALLFGSALTLAAVSGVWFSPAAHADSTKTCQTTTENQPSKGWQTETTNTQTSSCNSNSSTGFEPVSSTTTNPGGNQPPPKQQ